MPELRSGGILKRFLPRSLFGRSLLIIMLPIVLLQLVATYIFYERHWSSVTRRMALGIGGEIIHLINIHRRFDDPEEVQQAAHAFGFKVSLEAVEAFEPMPVRYATLFEQRVQRALNERIFLPVAVKDQDPDVRIQVQLDDTVLQITLPIKRLFSTTTYIFVLWMVGTSVILMSIALMFLRNQVRPILRLAKAADNFGKGREVTDFRPSGAVEIRRAGIAFLQMRERILRQIKQRTEMLAAVSHDLRTPLTRMKLSLEMMDDSDDNVLFLRQDVEDMEHMVNGFLAFSKGQPEENDREILVIDLAREVAASAERAGKIILVNVPERLKVIGKPNALKRCLTNLTDNARRYGETVSIEGRTLEDQIEIIVHDDGPGIPPEKRKIALKPFKRLDESRNAETGGAGLGLAIVRDIIRAHGGEMKLGSSPLGGLKVTLSLPR